MAQIHLPLAGGHPGTGKTTLCDLIVQELLDRGEPCQLVDERRQDAELFGDYWEFVGEDWSRAKTTPLGRCKAIFGRTGGDTASASCSNRLRTRDSVTGVDWTE
jgi:hypothetical protein